MAEKIKKSVKRAIDVVPKRSYRGELTIKSIDKKGNIFTYKTPNVITGYDDGDPLTDVDARLMMSHFIVGASDVNDLTLNYLAVGTDPTAALRTQIGLLSEVTKVPFTSFTFPARGQVEIISILDFDSPANGNTLVEAGLFSNNQQHMFARQVFGAIEKTIDIQLQFIWSILFT